MGCHLRIVTCFVAAWLSGFAGSESMAGADDLATKAAVDHGREVFLQNCALCHTTDPLAASGQGPPLAGIVGRRAASVPGFGYSKALTRSPLKWDTATLDRFLTDPGALVPGTAMLVSVTDPRDRSSLIAYLTTLSPAMGGPDTAIRDSPLTSPDQGDWRNDAPGRRHRIQIQYLPPPYATRSAGNSPHIVDQPRGAFVSVPQGFRARLFASGLTAPRLLRAAPCGDVFISETAAGRIRVLRAKDGADEPSVNAVFTEQLLGPFGIAFYPVGGEPRWLYVATLNSVIRFPYQNGDLVARGPAETIISRLSGNTGGHSTRDIAFSLDGQQLFISVGSGSNVAEGMEPRTPAEILAWEAGHAPGATWGDETNRADILVTDPEGRHPLTIFACGLRNAVGLAIHPATRDLWASTNERDGLGDDLVPDYLTRVHEGGFYGWPWYYLGNHEDPRHKGARPDLSGRVSAPDIPIQAHSATLQMCFYPLDASGPAAFPAEYRGDAFAAFHGSWNRTVRTGSKVVRVRLRNGEPAGEYEDFLTGFVVDDHSVWGRPVGVTVAHDGALLVTDDANGTIWRVSYDARDDAPSDPK